MKLIPMYPILKNTFNNGYAQGAFNVTTYQQLKSVLSAHEALRSPALIQVGNIALGYLGKAKDMNASTFEEKTRGAVHIRALLDSLSSEYSIPVALHADHAKDYEVIKMMIEKGFTSVMIDGSHLPFEENIELTREVVKLAHEKGVTVEGELGVLAGTEDDAFSEKSTYTNPMKVVEFVKKTAVDCLALSYGTKHGVRKGISVKLRTEIVTAAKENLLHEKLDTILVSHGSSTVPGYIVEDINHLGGKLDGVGGIPINELHAVIQCGIGKINIDTDMRLSITRNIRELMRDQAAGKDGSGEESVRKNLSDNPGEIDFRVILSSMRDFLVDGKPEPTAFEKNIGSCFERGVYEILGPLLVHFGSLGYANRIEALTLQDMAERYSTSRK